MGLVLKGDTADTNPKVAVGTQVVSVLQDHHKERLQADAARQDEAQRIIAAVEKMTLYQPRWNAVRATARLPKPSARLAEASVVQGGAHLRSAKALRQFSRS